MTSSTRTFLKRAGDILWPWILVLPIAAILPYALHLRFNTTPSLPIGIYRAIPPTEIRTGDLVAICLPYAQARLLRERQYLNDGNCPGRTEPLAKPVAAVAGDLVTHTQSAVTVNGQTLPNSVTRTNDHIGRRLPNPDTGTFRLSPDEIWLHSPYHPRSLDSRYLGRIKASDVREKIKPVWTRTPILH